MQGGKPGLYGLMERVARSPAAALGQSPTMEGLGLTQEGLETNPVMTELLMANLWADEDGIDLNDWLPQYVRARYSGTLPPQLNRAWAALRSSVYTDHAPDRPACCPTMMIVNRESKGLSLSLAIARGRSPSR